LALISTNLARARNGRGRPSFKPHNIPKAAYHAATVFSDESASVPARPRFMCRYQADRRHAVAEHIALSTPEAPPASFAGAGPENSSDRTSALEPASRADGEGSEELRIPLVEEEVRIGKREVETGHVRVRTHVEEEQVNLSEMLERELVDVERVPMEIEVETAPAPFRDKYGVLIVPIVEERLVVSKRLFVVEELRIHRRRTEERVEVPATRRVMRAEIERDSDGPPDTTAGATRGT
jgi:uncharacterized protein (TIGR02271 family)